MLTYTKATLKPSLQSWNVNADPDFVSKLDEIIQRGELRLSQMLDLDSLDTVSTTTTSATVPEVWKPDNLIVERLLLIAAPTGKKGVLPRSRAWVQLMNEDDEEGVPKYYCEHDEDRWAMAPIPNAALLIYVHGLFRPASITDGSDNTETWFSTRVPNLLWLACSIEANEFLKNWARKAQTESDLAEQAEDWLGIAAKLQRSDIEDLVGGRQNQNKPNTQGVTE